MNPSPAVFSGSSFHPVIRLPRDYEVYDFTQGYDENRPLKSPYGIGRYNEKRPGMYVTELFTAEEKRKIRDVHVGIDIAAPVGTEVFAFCEGEIFMTAINAAAGDYGGTVITRHEIKGHSLWALHGHLSHASTRFKKPGEKIKGGDVVAWVGDRTENGGWNPHLHFQLSWKRPEVCDLPGVVNDADLEQALATYPDPRLVLGPLY